MDLDIIAEKTKVEQDLASLKIKLSQLDQQRSQIAQQIIMRQGILQYLNSLNHKEVKGE